MASDPLLLMDLRQALPHATFSFPGSQEYEKKNKSYRSAINTDFRPMFIFSPISREEVSTFVRVIKPHALSGRIKLSIVGNGCQISRGCNNTHKGITIDMSSLRGIEIEDGGIVRIAAGETWGQVYDELQKKDLGVAGGMPHTSGVAGQALHGCPSFFYSRHGFICDNVINYEVVLASGHIVNANAEEHGNLLRALRGGGNNLGIVTRFDMRTFEQRSIFGGIFYYDIKNLPGQIDFLVSDLESPNPSKDTHIMITAYVFDYHRVVAENHIYIDDPIDRWPRFLEPFVPVGNGDRRQLEKIELAQAVKEKGYLDADTKIKLRYFCINTIMNADAKTLKDISTIYLETGKAAWIKTETFCQGMRFSLSLQPYTRAMLESSAGKGGNSLGLSPRPGPLVSVRLIACWEQKVDDDGMRSVTRDIMRRMRMKAEANDLQTVSYVDSNSGCESPITPEDMDALRHASHTYDPDGLFQIGVPGGFKLFNTP
ncbi:FAD-binding domain-containing protein [Hypoxylon cercidicola]|nr:FAD-binding domain-containing protein [Hypoxylon cercidicola]